MNGERFAYTINRKKREIKARMTRDLKRESRPGVFTFISFLPQCAIVMGPMFMLIMSSERMQGSIPAEEICTKEDQC